MENFGSFLKAHREKKGIRLEEIASITKIHLHNLDLLENGRWNDLPPEPFIRGFITAYAKYIGLDPKLVMDRYNEEVGSKVPSSVAVPPVESTPSTRPAPPQEDRGRPPADLIEKSPTFSFRQVSMGATALAVLFILIGIVYIGKHSTNDNSATTPSASVPGKSETPETTVSALTEKPATTTPDERDVASQTKAPEPVKAAPAHEVIIEGKERTWIKVVVDEEAPIEYFLPEGERATYRAEKKIKIVLGNSTGSKISHNGTATQGTKVQGTIRSYIFPGDARFPQDVPTKRVPTEETENTAATPPQEKDTSAPD